jgi:hypothetical protein
MAQLEPVAVFRETKRERRKAAKDCAEAVLKFLHLPQWVPGSECFHNFFLSVQDLRPSLPVALTIICESLFNSCYPRASADSLAQKTPFFSQELHGAVQRESFL